jgi:5'-methylthioadenosine/S-adenosylhomocysteine nucleosidase
MSCSAPPRPVTLVLGAVPWEVAPIEEALTDRETVDVAGIQVTRAKLDGMPVVVGLTGVGKTNTGLVLGLLYREFRPGRVIFTGTGARVRPDIKPGYVIVAQEASFHDAGNLTEQGMQLLPVFGPRKGQQLDPVFEPDPGLLAIALRVAAAYEPSESIRVDGESYPTVVRAGRITTGDLFSINQWKLDQVRTGLRADLLEMEGASVGQSCQILGVPWLLIRGGSDLLQAGDASGDYMKYGPIAARQAALFTLAVLKELAAGERGSRAGER